MKRYLLPILLVSCCFAACKNNGSGTTSAETKTQPTLNETNPVVKDVIVGAKRPINEKPDFSVLEWSVKGDVLTAVVRYTGGCKAHDFNAYFSGGWLKSLPAQAILDLEHVNLDNDPCRKLVKDTIRFDIKPLRYMGSNDVIVKWSGNRDMADNYKYGKK
ncbi:hypothetical protein OAE48_03390 [Flavobacteriales bacterium]|nr:hypothetical protein [Flavobacteriales bacterium]